MVQLGPSGNTGVFRCVYHAWTYDLAGKLVAFPTGMPNGFDPSEHGLHPCHVKVVQGFIWLSLARNEAPDFEPWIGNWKSVADKFDMAMSGMGRTFDRARTATFSKPYMRYGKLLMIRSADRDKYRSLADLDKPGLKIAYNRGGLNDRFANTEFKQATPAGYPSNELATADLLAGMVDAQVQDSTAAVYLSRQNPKLAAMAPENVFHPVFVAILMRREDQALQSYVNIWIDQIEMDGTLAKIRTKWLGS